MRRLILGAGILAAAAAAAQAAIPPRQSARFADAARVIQDVRDAIPAESWSRAHCVAVVPNLKKPSFLSGVEQGGVISCRAGDGWSAPMFVQLGRGAWRSQAGANDIDALLLVVNEQGVQKLLQGRITLGAETLTYSRANGVFAEFNLAGGVLRPDAEANAAIYGSRATPRTILATRAISAPTDAHAFLSALNVQGSPTRTAAAMPAAAARASSPGRSVTVPTTDDDLRTRVVDIQQMLDRMLADTTPSAVGTAGSTPPPSTATVTVDRARLLQIREQLDALLAGLNRR